MIHEAYIYEKTIYSQDNLIDQNDSDFSAKSNPSYKRQETLDYIFDDMNNKDWEKEAEYFNHYFVNGKVNRGRTIIKKK